MHHTAATHIGLLLIFPLIFSSCSVQQGASFDESQGTSSSELSSASSVMPRIETGSWLSYQSDKLKVAFVYPPSFTAGTVQPSTITFYRGETPVQIQTEGVQVRDGMPEGEGIAVSRTRDAAILEMLDTPYTHFMETKIINGVEYRTYSYDGMTDPVIYVGLKNNIIYYITLSWGLDNPVMEEIMKSFQILD